MTLPHPSCKIWCWSYTMVTCRHTVMSKDRWTVFSPIACSCPFSCSMAVPPKNTYREVVLSAVVATVSCRLTSIASTALASPLMFTACTTDMHVASLWHEGHDQHQHWPSSRPYGTVSTCACVKAVCLAYRGCNNDWWTSAH